MSGFRPTQNKQMNFFAEQRLRTRRSLLLYSLFLLVVLAHMLVGLAIMALLLTVFTGGIYYWIMVSVVVWILFSFGAGSLVEYRRLQAGGRAIAQRVGAVRLFIDTSQDAWQHSSGVAHQHQTISAVRTTAQHIAVRHERDFPPLYRRYYEFAQQLAIASGISTPILYVMTKEQGINGFVAGRDSQDMVMVVTLGALEQLSDEGLYGLIGHEYGHIIHGDATFNLQLMIVLAGLQILYDWSEPIDNHVNGRSREDTRGVWALLLHGLSFSSMASEQLIKHSFNRQRELLADATSVQLTRSPAILTTLKTIHQSSHGSRLSTIADINGLSHFFFASSGADVGDVSWLATHPSLTERMSAINANEYQSFARQVAQQQRLNDKMIKEIYEQRRRGTWGELKENSLSSNALNHSISNNSNNSNNLTTHPLKNTNLEDVINNDDLGLEFTIESDVVIDGRLQVVPEVIGSGKLVKPWQALLDSDLPSHALIAMTDIEQVSLPHYILNHSHHPLGALALIESILLCHQQRLLSTSYRYTLSDIWCGLSERFTETEKLINNSADTELNQNSKILAHTIDYKLLAAVANLDRRMDSAIIAMTMHKLKGHDLSAATVAELQRLSIIDHSHKSHEHYKKQQHARTMLLCYQQGLIDLFNHELGAQLTGGIAHFTEGDCLSASAIRKRPSILSLWQALHLQQLLPVLDTVLAEKGATTSDSYQPILLAAIDDIINQLDPSGEIFKALNAAQRTMVIVFAYRLANDTVGKMSSMLEKESSMRLYDTDYVLDIRRHARLIDIDLSAVSDVNLQWLLLTAQNLNSVQLLAIIKEGASAEGYCHHSYQQPEHQQNHQQSHQQNASQITYNDNEHSSYRLWLSTLHTVMLHDTIISQDEYDCLTVLAEHWLGVRQLVD